MLESEKMTPDPASVVAKPRLDPKLALGVGVLALVAVVLVALSRREWAEEPPAVVEEVSMNMSALVGEFASDADNSWRLAISLSPDAAEGAWDGVIRLYAPTLELYDGSPYRCQIVDTILQVEFKKAGAPVVVQMFEVVDAATLGLELSVAAFPGYMRKR